MQHAQSAVEAFRLMGLPAAAIVNDGRVLAVNALFESVTHGVRVLEGRILLSGAAAMERYHEALATLRGGSTRHQSIFLPTGEAEPPAILHLVPMAGLDEDTPTEGGSLVVITSLSPRALPGSEMLQGLFDLTPAEARLAIGLAGGNKIGELARLFKVSHETIRSQIKQVFAKTRTRSQAELVGLLTRLPPLS